MTKKSVKIVFDVTPEEARIIRTWCVLIKALSPPGQKRRGNIKQFFQPAIRMRMEELREKLESEKKDEKDKK